jgi:hypothetical protein
MTVGDQQAINGMTLDLTNDLPKSSHYPISHTSKRLQQPEDVEYLRMKGCFTLPPTRHMPGAGLALFPARPSVLTHT